MDSQKNHRANNPVSKTLTLVVIATFLFSTSCTSTRVIKSQPDILQNELKIGDVVKITTKDEEKFKLKIVEITSGAIIGLPVIGKKVKGGRLKPHNNQIPFNEIAKIEKTEANPKKIIGVFGILLLAGIMWLSQVEFER